MQVKQEVLYTGSFSHRVLHKEIVLYEEDILLSYLRRILMESEIEGYSFQCLYCDEDFTLSEAVIKTEEDEKDKQ